MQNRFIIGDLATAEIILDDGLLAGSPAYIIKRTDLAAASQVSPSAVRETDDPNAMIGECEIIVRNAILQAHSL